MSSVQLNFISGYTPPGGSSVTLDIGASAGAYATIENPFSDAVGGIATGEMLSAGLDGIVSSVESTVLLGVLYDVAINSIVSDAQSEILTGETLQASIDGISHVLAGVGAEFGATFSAIDNPQHQINAQFLTGFVLNASIVNPIALTASNIQSIEVLNASLLMPVSTISATAFGENNGNVTAPLPIISSLAGVNFGSVSMVLPVVASSFITGNSIRVQIENPLQVVSSLLYPLPEIEIISPSHFVLSEIAVGEVISSTLVPPMHEYAGSIISDVLMSASMVNPSPFIEGMMTRFVSDRFNTYAVNVDTFDVTEYTNQNVLAMGRVGDNYVLATGEGIFVIGGELDDGNNIDCSFEFGKEDFGKPNVKNVNYVYVSGDGALDMSVTLDADKQSSTYSSTHVKNATAKIKFGKGLRSRYWQPNFRGNKFLIEALDMDVENLSRRVG